MDGIRGLALSTFVCILTIILAGAPRGFAQGQNAILTGTIADNDGVIPGAMVIVTDPATGLTRSAESNEQGVFRVLSLPAGRHSVRVEMAGFRQINLNDIQLVSGETRDLGRLVLEVGTLAEACHGVRRSHTGEHDDRFTSEEHDRRPAHDDSSERTRHLRHDEDPAGRERHDFQPRLRRLAVGPRAEHQRRHVAQQEHDD